MSFSFKDVLHNNYTRVLLYTLLGFIGISIAYMIIFYFYQLKSYKEIEKARLSTIANTIALQIDGHELDYLLKRYPRKNHLTTNYANGTYNKIHQLFKEIKDKNNIHSDIYTLCYQKSKDNFLFGITSSETPYYNHEYNSYPEKLKTDYELGGFIQPYEDKHGYWISAFAPIYNRYHEVVSVVQVDQRFDRFITQARLSVLKQVAYISVFIALSGFIIIRAIFKFLSNEERIKMEITNQKKIIENKNFQITSSIAYAKRIQEAVMPALEAIKQAFPKSFILFLPRDIVSGDFYYCSQKHEDLNFIAVADCTGHGVPGALMSMISTSLLNEVINEKGIKTPGKILEEVEDGLKKAFNAEKSTSDGMDIALCAFDKSLSRVFYSGAYRPMYIIRNQEIIEHKANRYSIGGERKINYGYNTVGVDLHEGDCIYLFSDGFSDQFGGSKKSKFMIKRFKKLLLEIHKHPMEEQQALLTRKLHEWQGDSEQIDDITVLGINI